SRDIREMLKCSRDRDRSGLFCLGAINLCPPMHRGVSWAASFRLHFQNTVGSLQVLAWRAIQEYAIDTSGLPFHVRDSLEWFRMHDQVIEQCGREAYDHLVEEEQTRLRRAEKTEALLSRRRRMIQDRTN
ncbi:MAG: hypothetical protein Q8P67_01485, partial [archaeon]|nr:hypothetical protein [archaeon]